MYFDSFFVNFVFDCIVYLYLVIFWFLYSDCLVVGLMFIVAYWFGFGLMCYLVCWGLFVKCDCFVISTVYCWLTWGVCFGMLNMFECFCLILGFDYDLINSVVNAFIRLSMVVLVIGLIVRMITYCDFLACLAFVWLASLILFVLLLILLVILWFVHFILFWVCLGCFTSVCDLVYIVCCLWVFWCWFGVCGFDCVAVDCCLFGVVVFKYRYFVILYVFVTVFCGY